jgi:outer membrane protein OmpA-like peptidoglycan-associated protein
VILGVRAALALLLMLGAASAAPDFGVLEGAELKREALRDFDGYDMPIGPFGPDLRLIEPLEGQIGEYVYRVERTLSTLFAIRNYEDALKQVGYEVRYQCGGRACGGFDFRFGAYIVPPPAMRLDLGDFRYLAATNRDEGLHATVIASRQGGALYLQVMTVKEAAATPAITNAPTPRAKPDDARLYALARHLTMNGHAVVEGIDFAPGAGTLTKGSAAALAQAAQLLRSRPDITFRVVGHTDNEGALELNLKLSQSRAEAVADALASVEGVERRQLTAHGLGYLAPRASNATEEGRALNRRVELVLE